MEIQRCLRCHIRIKMQATAMQQQSLRATARPFLAFNPRVNSRCRCQVSITNTAVTEATAVTEGLLFGRGDAGSWDAAAVGHPVVRCYMGDNEQRWYMWYSGSNKPMKGLHGVAAATGSVGIAVSSDGINWLRGDGLVEGHRSSAAQAQDVGVVLQPNSDNWWTLDTCHLAVSDVQILSNGSVSSGVGVWWMFYSGGDFESVAAPGGFPGLAAGAAAEGLRMRPGLAMSQDGRNWARIEGDHHTGALFDVGAAGEWDESFIGHPCVLAAGPKDMRMFYHSYDAAAGRFKIGLATSRDGFNWAKQGPVFEGGSSSTDFDAAGAAACHVVRDPDSKQFLMFYEAVAADGSRSIGLATSADGRSSWQRMPQPVLAAADAEQAWDAGSVGCPCVVPMSAGRWRLYYAGRASQHGPWEGIGVALGGAGGSSGCLLSFKRRTGAQQ